MSSMPKHPRRLRALAAGAIALLALTITGAWTATPSSGKAMAAPPSVQAPVLPTPLRFVSNLDLECFRTNFYQPPITSVFTRHINPVLTHLPAETVTLGPREQLCVPVAKNHVLPPPEVLEFIKYVDLSCYRIQGITVNQTLALRHLNPQLQTLPGKTVVISQPQQLCVPVVKNGLYPPPEIRALVAYIDLKCYLAQPQVPLNISLTLSHLNPVLSGLPSHVARVTYNRQLCVPVHKNNQPIPVEVYNIVRYIDLEKYDIVTPALVTPVSLTINHLNPSLVGLPTENVIIQSANQLLLPVSKNNAIPPG